MKTQTSTFPLFSIMLTLTVLLTSALGFADTEVRGLISQDTRWTVDKSPYLATGSLIVNQGVTLTIAPGVTVKFNPNTALQVDGTLVARGTSEMPITFTAAQDKVPGAWGHILFTDKSTPTELDNAENYIKGSILEYATIEYAGGIQEIGAAVMVKASNLLVDHCTIRNSARIGVFVRIAGFVDGGKYAVSKYAVIRNSKISDNKGGGISAYRSLVIITSNTITGNTASSGGGIVVSSDAVASITNNTITGNTASSRGGGIDTNGIVVIINNVINGNTAPQGAATALLGGSIQNFSSNTVIDNVASGNAKNTNAIYIQWVPLKFKNNSIYNVKTDFDIFYNLPKGTDMNATDNYWGTADEAEIGARIYDFVTDVSKGVVNFVPFLTSVPGSSVPTSLALTTLDAFSVKLAWNANPDPDVAGYKVYYDTDANLPYEGRGAKEGDSPIDVKNVTTFTVSGLKPDATYTFVVTAYYPDGKESGFSTEVRSNSLPRKPSNAEPADAAKDVALTPTLKSSPFSDPDAGAAHKASQWQLTVTAGNYATPVYDSGANLKNLTSITLADGTLNTGTTYYWHVRHQDNRGTWSEYSAETKFTTSASKYPPWDVNQDGVVNILDLVLVGRHFGEDYRTVVAAIASSLPEIGVFSGKTTDVQMVVQNKVGLQGRRLLWVDINTGPVEDLYGCQFDLVFDPKALEVVSVKAGDVLAGDGSSIYWYVSEIDNRMGKIVDATYVRKAAKKGVNASGTLATVIFEVKDTSASEATRLTLSDIKLADADARFIKAITEPATLKWTDLIVPEKSLLLQNFPNPFNPETWIPYQLATDADVVLMVYDANGRLVRELALGSKAAGMYTSKDRAIYWDGRNAQGEAVASGIYLFSMKAGDFTAVRRALVVK